MILDNLHIFFLLLLYDKILFEMKLLWAFCPEIGIFFTTLEKDQILSKFNDLQINEKLNPENDIPP